MITLVIRDTKKKETNIECYDSLDKASKRLEQVGPKLKRDEKLDPKRRYILEGASWDSNFEGELLKPYLYPDKQKD